MTALVIQHMPQEDAGLMGTVLERLGIAVHVVKIFADQGLPPPADFDFMLVMGGSQQVWEVDQHPWLVDEMAAIREWVTELHKPYFGICLGHQLLAEALGGKVGRANAYELGFPKIELLPAALTDPLFSTLPENSHWLQWHEAEVSKIPPGAKVMARSDACAVQAMSIGTQAVSLQFHAEATADLIEKWTSDVDTVNAMKEQGGSAAPIRIREEAVDHLAQAQDNAERLFTRWLELNHLGA